MSQPNSATPSQQNKASRKDHWIKLGFLVVLLIGAAVIWLLQRREPELKGWGTDLDAGLQQAKQEQTKVVVLFTRKSMGHWDKRIVRRCMLLNPTIKVLRHLGYVKVHLTKERSRRKAEQFEVTDTPTVLLLDADGRVLKKHTGFMTDLDFCNKFLGMSAKQVSELQRAPG